MSKIARMRVIYTLATVALIAAEVVIALFVRDSFIRPYFGDMLVVVVIYTFVRIFVPDKCGLLALYIFIFAVSVEALQYFDIVKILGLEDLTFLRLLVGSTFDIKDIACYAVGCIAVGIYDLVRYALYERKSGRQG